ncbi:PTS system mannose/fructose/sorbose family transporter subunit IID [Gilliamella sp. B2776]|uniref:PTS system mannose/fructose/sorbose family transporter subunit IID n=1 Tax=unclassified Gilliamella TaxID=2685620 RepID=UPI00226A63FC|nr:MULTISPECIES: PTS system mannose/fructose/sorbose family transporter subunit IID [unclassified Gilliamella]MCX8649798.1 PTS system mannose/fructose/sorbose family transporter subunit IID [Gilliamella sp. B2779]MCX8653691.1 PTS system mannose/fructose/sorbose family transporter subunit IID [Gilliamella sp. B2737]MCX8656118.1 PTS system mannose/fructose/sorbose family transporter subunit IID [Gilliamella sp. B2894]MCX8691571.1 PTS system mannose/fructose/sorbose family transporter subunit IID 
MVFNDENDSKMAAKAEKRMEQSLSTSKVSTDTYIDQSQNVTLTKVDINRMAFRSLALQASFNYERMQAGGWLYTILPALRKIHKNSDDLKNSMHMHMEFINVHPFDVTFLSGLVLAMEKGKENISTIRSIKVALMGPLGGIGDALFWLTLLPICAGIGASLALEGSFLGPIIFLLIFNLVHFGLRFGLAHYGYHAGTSALPLLKIHTKRISHAASIIGMTVIGALVASYVHLSTPLEINAGKAHIALQADVLDKLMPNLLPLGFTLFVYYLMKRNFSPVKLIGLTVVIGIFGKLVGYL